MPILPLLSPVSGRSATVNGISMRLASPQLDRCSERNCGVKSVGCPGTLYSYGPRCAEGSVMKLPCGGGEGAAHSRVVACHGFSSTFLPCLMLQKKLTMNGICAIASPQAEYDMKRFQCRTGWAKS